MNNRLYAFYFFILAIVSIFTGEMITFIMLGIILISLTNIHTTLKEILELKKKEKK